MTPQTLRLPLIALAILALSAAVWAGWIRLGWRWPILQPGLIQAHGALMVGGFLGTLISLERAVALGKRWMYPGPLLSGLGALVLILESRGLAGPILITLGSLWLVAIFTVIVQRHFAIYTAVMAAGAVAWLVGNIFWLAGWPVYRIVLFWAVFLILTVAGERLEMGRILRFSRRVENAFLLAAILIGLGLVLSLLALSYGGRLTGFGLLALSAWLLRFDIARRTVRQERLPRYAAICLLIGYIWLGIGGLLLLIYGLVPAGFLYDAVLHSLFLGFVISMIFGHAPIIFPAVLGLPIRYSPVFYTHLALLHLSLVVRVAGDLFKFPSLRLWGGLFNGIAVLLFLANTALSMAKSSQEREGRKALHTT